MMTNSMKTRLRSVIVVATAACLPLLTGGCLLLAERPVNDIGEECKSSKNCPEWGYCGATSPGEELGTCLPTTPECTTEVAEACGGYTCNVTHSYCKRSCGSSADCVAGYDCDFADDYGEPGTCVLSPDAECTALDASACGRYACSGNGIYAKCEDYCIDYTDCAPGFGCQSGNCL